MYTYFMKSKFVLFLSVISPLIFVTVTFAQTPTQTPFQFYTSIFSQYRDALRNYETASAAYLQFGTLKSRTDAEVATKTMLRQRSETVIAYLTAISAQIQPLEDYNQPFLTEIDADISWYRDQIPKINSAASLDELVFLSDEFALHYEASTLERISIYVLLVNFRSLESVAASINGSLNSLNSQNLVLNDRISTNLSSAQNLFSTSQSTLTQAKSLLKPTDNRSEIDVDTIEELQTQIKSNLGKTTKFLLEISSELKL